MKTLLVAINAKYEHEGLAVWYLKAACQKKGIPTVVRQFSINDSSQRIWSSIMEEKPDAVGFSCYIWNREQVLNLISDIKKAKPSTVLLVGGPEVSYEGSEQDFKAAGADFVIKGEGEGKLPSLLTQIFEHGLQSALSSFDNETCCREEETGYISPFLPEYLNRIRDRISYIESSRGCPYRCSYCLSSQSSGLVLFPLDEVKADIEDLVASGAKVIKFVDRSFNVNEEHSLGIWEFIRRFPNDKVTFHFEINPDRLTEAQINCLKEMPAGLIQIEAGIQSVNSDTLRAVSRVMDVDRALENLKILVNKGNIHVHTDLIAGLPFEDKKSLIESFNRVYEVGAHHLQLGFLKLIHGTRIRRDAENHGYKYRDYPPYEVIESKYLSSDEILTLKGIEEVLDRTYNSGRLVSTLDYLVTLFDSPYKLYEALSQCFRERELLYVPLSATRLYECVREFSQGIENAVPDKIDGLIALDYACSMRTTVLPEFLAGGRVEALESRNYVDESIFTALGKKEFKKRFMVLSGSFPLKNKADFICTENKMLVDTHNIDPVTGRAIPRPLNEAMNDSLHN